MGNVVKQNISRVISASLARMRNEEAGKPKDVAAAAIYLADEESDFVTGQIIFFAGHETTAVSLAWTWYLYSPYVTHRLPELWENPDAFDPERCAPGWFSVEF
jgi:cytochrome P450